MKRNLLLFLCIIAMVASCLVACNNDNNGNEECTHTFSEAWYSDADEHWHPATCEHAETERGDVGAHADSNEDGKCDVCEYEVGHTHTFSNDWTKDATHHWKKSTCTHTDEKLQYSTHSDENMDGSCDICSGHVHDVNPAGYCKLCGEKVSEVDTTDLAALIEAILTQSYLVNGGEIDYNFEGRSNSGSQFNAHRNEKVDYTFGKDNYTHVFVDTHNLNGGYNTKIPVNGQTPVVGENGNWIIGDVDTGVNNAEGTPYEGLNGMWLIGGTERTGTLETWHQLSGEDQSFGVVSENGGATALDISNAARLNGYYIALSTLAGDYGVESTLYALYEAAISDTTTDLTITPGAEENTITIKYNYNTVFVNESEIIYGENVGSTVYNVNHFNVEVTIGYSDDLALTYLNIVVDCYTNDPGTADGVGFLYDDVDISYDPDTRTVSFVKYDHELGKYLVIHTATDENGETYYYVEEEKYNAETQSYEKTGEIIIVDAPTPDTYVITVTQTVGERTEENPNSQSKYIPTRFDIYSKEEVIEHEDGTVSYKLSGKITGTLTAHVGDTVYVYFGNYYPDNTSLDYIAEHVSFKLYKDDVLVENPDDILENPSPIAAAVFTHSGGRRHFFIIPRVDGNFRFEIYVMGELKKTVNIVVGNVDPEDIELKDNEFAVNVSEAYEWSSEYTFTAEKSGTYIFNLPAGVGFINADLYDAAMENPNDELKAYFDYQTAEKNPDGTYKGGSFRLELEAGQTIRFYINAVKKGTYVIAFYEPTE